MKHFSCFYMFLGCPLYQTRWHLWGAVLQRAARFVPAAAVLRGAFDATTKKKAGRQIEGLASYRNGTGCARQEYRTLRGVHFVVGILRFPLAQWPGHSLSVPMGEAAPTPPKKRRGAPRQKGDGIGAPKPLAQTPAGWTPHPTEAGAELQAWDGLWQLGVTRTPDAGRRAQAGSPRCLPKAGQRGRLFTLYRYRPWDRRQVAPSQLEVMWACREPLQGAGILPIPRFRPALAENPEEPADALPLAA